MLICLGPGHGSSVQTLSTLMAASHPSQIHTTTEYTPLPAKRVHSKVLVTRAALFASLEHLSTTERAGLLLGFTESERKGKSKLRVCTIYMYMYLTGPSHRRTGWGGHTPPLIKSAVFAKGDF